MNAFAVYKEIWSKWEDIWDWLLFSTWRYFKGITLGENMYLNFHFLIPLSIIITILLVQDPSHEDKASDISPTAFLSSALEDVRSTYLCAMSVISGLAIWCRWYQQHLVTCTFMGWYMMLAMSTYHLQCIYILPGLMCTYLHLTYKCVCICTPSASSATHHYGVI